MIDRNWRIQSALLGCSRFSGSLHSRVLLDFCEEMLDKYSIVNKLSCITFDPELFGLNRFPLHNLDLSIFDVPIVSQEKAQEENESNGVLAYDFDNEMESFLAGEDSSQVEPDTPTVKVDLNWNERQIPCVLHVLQSCIRDAPKPENLHNALTVSLEFVHNAFKANVLDEALNKDEVTVKTRWGLELGLLRSVLKSGTFDLKPFESIVSEFISILEPLEEVASLLMSETSPISNSLPCYRGLISSLQNLSLSHCASYRDDLLALLRKRLDFIEKKNCFAFAAILNPNFGTLWCSSEEERKWEVILIQSIIEHVKKNSGYQDSFSNQTMDSSVCTVKIENQLSASIGSPTSSEPSRKRLKVFDFMKKNRIQAASKDDSVVESVKEYLEEMRQNDGNEREIDLLDYWRSKQIIWVELSSFARHVFQIAAVSYSHDLRFKDYSEWDDDFESFSFLKTNQIYFAS